MSLESSQTSGSRRQHIRKFQSRVLNRSCADFLFYDKVADYLLQCCSAQAKPSTLSVFSLIPLIICDSLIAPGQWWSFLSGIVAILMHQIFDIANKKQAYRLSQFNMVTYYVDHLFDSISCVLIVDICAQLLRIDNQSRLTCIFFFGMLPFFTHHLAMYTNGYLTFYNISPAVQGLLIIKLFFLVCIFVPDIPTQFIFDFQLSQILISLCSIWLIIFLLDDMRTIAKVKKGIQSEIQGRDNMPLKNLFVIGALGYIIIENTMIESKLLEDGLYFRLLTGTFTWLFSYIISQLVLSYGFSEKHRQFTPNILICLFLTAVFYSIVGFIDFAPDIELIIGQIYFAVIFVSQIAYFIYYHYKNVKYLHNIIRGDQ